MDKTLPHKLFLLGGCDLEMLTIKRMLEGWADCVVLDRHLGWGNALLSAYQEYWVSFQYSDIFGIELVEDIPVPNNYHRIDHHGDWDHKPCALEQVADIIGVTLNRYQQLVAANDKGYIPAMRALGATADEMADIRREDRIAQGVTEQDYLLAKQSVEQNLSKYDKLLVVNSMTSRFSPICDTLFPYERLLIYTDSQWMFYGEGKKELVSHFAEEINEKKMFHGGGSNGYIGCVDSAYSQMEIEQIVKQIINQYEHI